MSTPRIILRQADAATDRLTAEWYTRYGIAVGIMLLASGAAMLGRGWSDAQEVQLPLFVGVLLSSVIGGLGPG
ncbi:MAG TPA: hypothetical protein VNL70_10280, partial [Tepidisphaeraceae bacterium]|nr:hypothetical protein [Tepidisphaeraceae bacterium]